MMRDVEVEGKILFETAAAILFTEDEEDPGLQIWLPKNWITIEYVDEDEKLVKVTLPPWLAKEKGYG
jgi:hypothetical protein